MNARFQSHTERMPALFAQLQSAEPFLEKGVAWQKDKKGIYLMLENGKPVYIGRTRNLQGRLRNHITPSERNAAFAFRRARQALNRHATYKPDGSRARLMEDPEFHAAFLAQIEAIREMPVRFLEVTDPVDQYLLELYAHMELDLPLHEFDTH